MSQREVKELATAGASWWAGHFGSRAPKPRTGVGVVEASASLLSDVPPPTADQVAAFRVSLESGLIAALTKSSGWLTVRTDYDPDALLAGAMEAAGLEADFGVLFLPWKTKMEFRDGQITVRSLGKPDEHI